MYFSCIVFSFWFRLLARTTEILYQVRVWYSTHFFTEKIPEKSLLNCSESDSNRVRQKYAISAVTATPDPGALAKVKSPPLNPGGPILYPHPCSAPAK